MRDETRNSNKGKEKKKDLKKKQGGIFRSIVYEYAPEKGIDYTKKSESSAVKAKPMKKTKDTAKTNNDESDCQVISMHEGLPVQERKCMGTFNNIH